MNHSIFERLQLDFIKIRHLFSDSCNDKFLVEETLEDIKKIRAKIIKKTNVEEKRLILYCIDTLLEIVGENNEKKIFDFADTIHNMPEICLGKRNIYSFTQEILAFQKLYGKEYFPTFKKAKPKFQRKAPKNIWEYFTAESDEDFKKLHPVGYKFLCGIGIAVLLLPFIIYSIYIFLVNSPMPMDAAVSVSDFLAFILGLIGTFVVGIGLFNIVSAWIHQYLGHFLTFICIFGGGVLTALSLFLLYN